MLVGALLVPSAAFGHAELVSSDPLPNASLVTAPGSLAISFSEPIDPERVSVEVLDVQLRPQAGLGTVLVDSAGTGISVDLPTLVPDVYTVRYSVVSTLDGHATTGFFAFVVDPTGAQAPPTAPSESSSPSADAWAIGARWLALLASLVALGSLIAWWNVGRARRMGPPWRIVGLAAVIGSVALASYLVLSARTIPSGIGDTGFVFDPLAPFGWTAFAIAMRVALLGTLVAGVAALVLAWRPPSSGGWAVGGVAGLLGIGMAGMSAAGHAASLGGPINVALDWLHLVAAAAWLGALPALFWLARQARLPVRELLRRHGRIALVAAPLVVLTGVANSPLVLGSARGLVGSEYGNLLVAKAALASIAIGVGAANHLLLRGRGRGHATRLVATEVAVAVVAVMAASAMVTMQPASARQDVVVGPAIQPAHFFGQAGPAAVHASVSVPATGIQTYQVTIRDAATGGPRDDVQRVFMAFDPPPGSGLHRNRVTLEPSEFDGLYTASGAATPVVGEWSIGIIVRREGAEDESVSFGMAVQEPSPPVVAPPPDTGIGVPGPLALLWAWLPPGLIGWTPALLALTAVLVLGRRRWAPQVRLPLAGVAVVLFLAVGSRSLVDAANRPTAEELAPYTGGAPGDPAAGRPVYLANCAACHGTDGQGDGPLTTAVRPGPFAERIPHLSDAELSYAIVNGVAGVPMPAFAASLTERERQDLVSYLRQRFGGP
ncbi:MAG: copper resistance protein CopC [Candidatus Limnocylindria bacterium]